ncbi:MAG: hypothetical protein ABIS38_01270 [Sphingomicrobium sp.]
MDKSVIPFTPTTPRPRNDGWTVERQYDFIEALAESGCVIEACRRVGMSDTSAYKLRARSDCQDFRRAWVVALDYGDHRIEEDARTRSRRGVARPIFYKGEQIGDWRHYDERLTMFFLRTRFPERYGKQTERVRGPDEEPDVEPGIALEGALTGIEFCAKDIPPDEIPPDDAPPENAPSENESGDDGAPGDRAPEQP